MKLRYKAEAQVLCDDPVIPEFAISSQGVAKKTSSGMWAVQRALIYGWHRVDLPTWREEIRVTEPFE